MIDKAEFKALTKVDIDGIASEMCYVLGERGWSVNYDGIMRNLEVWYKNKKPKIIEICEHPNYNGNLQIITPAELKRECLRSDAYSKIGTIINRVSLIETSYLYNGKTVGDYINDAASDVEPMIDYDNSDKVINLEDCFSFIVNHFTSSGRSKEIENLRNKIYSSLIYIRDDLNECISSNLAEKLNCVLELDKKKVREGQKTSKVVNRILHMTDYVPYNELFTEFADMINNNLQHGYYVISLNPLDYIRMSDGVSWSSCHTTDPNNTRRLDSRYSGQYAQGCLSYMNDSVSIVTYFVNPNADVNHPDRSGKIYRNMIYKADSSPFFVQGRVYPQSNDTWKDIYVELANLFMNVNNYTDYVDKGAAKEIGTFITLGANYPDYDYFYDCRIYSSANYKIYDMAIGNTAYSLKSGEPLNKKETSRIV